MFSYLTVFVLNCRKALLLEQGMSVQITTENEEA